MPDQPYAIIPSSSASIADDIRKLVVARVRTIPTDISVAIGSGEYTKEELLQNVEDDTELGREIIESQMEYLRDLASGAIYAGQ